MIKCIGYNLYYELDNNRKYYCSINKKEYTTDKRHKAIMTIEDRKTYSFHPSISKEEIYSFITNKYTDSNTYSKMKNKRINNSGYNKMII